MKCPTTIIYFPPPLNWKALKLLIDSLLKSSPFNWTKIVIFTLENVSSNIFDLLILVRSYKKSFQVTYVSRYLKITWSVRLLCEARNFNLLGANSQYLINFFDQQIINKWHSGKLFWEVFFPSDFSTKVWRKCNSILVEWTGRMNLIRYVVESWQPRQWGIQYLCKQLVVGTLFLNWFKVAIIWLQYKSKCMG